MTVYIEKPALNLREELASLRNQGGYQEQQFYFDGLVTNGTFDTDTSGWTAVNATLSIVSGALRVADAGSASAAYQLVSLVVGKVYSLTFNLVGTSSGNAVYGVGTGAPNGSSTVVGGTGDNTTSGAGVYSLTFTATSTSGYVTLGSLSTFSADFDNVSVFTSDGTDVIHTMPKGWKPKDFFEDGLLQREGALNDYEVVYDGFDYAVKPTVAPSATTQTCVIGVKA